MIRKLFSVLGLLLMPAFLYAGVFNDNYRKPEFNPTSVTSTTGTSITATATMDEIKVSTANGNVTVTLPDIDTISGTKAMKIRKTTEDGHIVTIDPYGSQTIDNITAYVLTHAGDFAIIESERTGNWRVEYVSAIVQVRPTSSEIFLGGETQVNKGIWATLGGVVATSTQYTDASTTAKTITGTSITIPTGVFTQGKMLVWEVIGLMSDAAGGGGNKDFRLIVDGDEVVHVTTTGMTAGDFVLICKVMQATSTVQRNSCLLVNASSTIDVSTSLLDLSSGGTALISMKASNTTGVIPHVTATGVVVRID